MTSELIRGRPGAFDIKPAWQDRAQPIADGVFLSQGLSNSYLVVTSAGRVVVNTGMGFEAAHHKRLYDAIDSGPVRYILLTQGHVDHVGGVDHFREAETLLIAQRNNMACQADDERIHRFRTKRSMPYWADTIAKADRFIKAQPPDAPIPAQSKPIPDVLFDDGYEFTLGATTFELISTPGGETIDSTIIVLAEQGLVLCGNVFSALIGHVPNLVTLRADRLRYALPFIAAVQRVIDLEPEILCPGHGEPLRGRTAIRGELERLRDGVQYLHDATVDGMNAGKDVIALMREIKLPNNLSLGEGYGNVAWDVRAIWEGYAGWFHARSTTELYPLTPEAIAGDLVDLAGGAAAVVAAARRRLDTGDAIEAVALLETALAAAPDDRPALEAYVAAHEALLQQHAAQHTDDFQNFWLVGWLGYQISATQQRLADLAPGAS